MKIETKNYSEVLDLFDEAKNHPKFQQYLDENRKRINKEKIKYYQINKKKSRF